MPIICDALHRRFKGGIFTLAENTKIRDYINLTSYHAAEYTGKGVKVCVLENPTTHNQKAVNCLREAGPDAELIWVSPSYANDKEMNAIFPAILATGAQILTMSLNMTPLTPDQTKALLDSGMTLLMSAGNNDNKGLSVPARDNNWLSVGALNMPFDKPVLEDYSARGPELDTVSFIPWINYGYIQSPNGTSFSCPFFAGVLACYFQYFKEIYGRFPSQPEVVELIKTHSKDLEVPGFDNRTAYGVLILPDMEVKQMTTEIVMDVSVQMINDRIMVPVRFVAEAFGGIVKWNEDTQTATFIVNGKTVDATLGSKVLKVM